MHEKIKKLIREKETCVLSTISGNKPYCSLMAYVTDADCCEIYMVTDKNSSKFKNLSENPNVSLLIDTRSDNNCLGLSDTNALTITGIYEKMDDMDLIQKTKNILLEKHPHIKEILDQPNAEILRIKMISFLMLKGLTKSFFEEL